MRGFICILLILSFAKCKGQEESNPTFGTLNIDHHSIAIQFMNKLRQKDYEYCYDQTSDSFRNNLNLVDFQFKMNMLLNLSNETFHHYNTTFIGKTAKEGLAILNGEQMTKNIMPEYDFTIASQAEKEFKEIQIFIRFESENSDKIGIINFSRHNDFNKQSNSSIISNNPFFVGKYILIAEDEVDYHIDIRGENLRKKLTKVALNLESEATAKVNLDLIRSFIAENDLSTFSLIHVIQKDNLTKPSDIEQLANENGFSVFNHRHKNYRLTPVNSLEDFLSKYQQSHWNPIDEKSW